MINLVGKHLEKRQRRWIEGVGLLVDRREGDVHCFFCAGGAVRWLNNSYKVGWQICCKLGGKGWVLRVEVWREGDEGRSGAFL
jgi:hypothetical protein